MNGVNFIDTADVYQNGRAERFVGRWLQIVDRQQAVIATKVGGRTWSGSNGKGCGRKHLREACEVSLRRPGTEYIDLFQLHSFGPGTPVGETISALTALVVAGKILYWGPSNWPVPLALNLLENTRASRAAVPISGQNRLNLLRFAEAQRYGKLAALGLLVRAARKRGLRVECAPATWMGGVWQTCRELIDAGSPDLPVGASPSPPTPARAGRGYEPTADATCGKGGSVGIATHLSS